LTSPTGLIQYRYGPDSFSHHVQQAKETGASLKVVNDPILALDLDLPEDIAYLKQVHGAIENLEITFPDPILYMEAK
jgi:2-phospho-L-lactate guanylyltransferase (CobY/MobA/RfbA family)